MPRYLVQRGRKSQQNYKYVEPPRVACPRCLCSVIRDNLSFHLCSDLQSEACANGFDHWVVCRKDGDKECDYHDVPPEELPPIISAILAKAPPVLRREDAILSETSGNIQKTPPPKDPKDDKEQEDYTESDFSEEEGSDGTLDVTNGGSDGPWIGSSGGPEFFYHPGQRNTIFHVPGHREGGSGSERLTGFVAQSDRQDEFEAILCWTEGKPTHIHVIRNPMAVASYLLHLQGVRFPWGQSRSQSVEFHVLQGDEQWLSAFLELAHSRSAIGDLRDPV